MRLSSRQEKSPKDRLRPAGWIYWLLALPAALLLRLLFALRISKDRSVRRLKGPAILIGNHPSYLDPLIMAVALLPGRIRFLTTRDLFRNRFISRLLGWLGAIPKTQFRTDLQAIKSVLRTIRSGGMVAIYPEGQRSIDGCLQPVDDSLYKLLKKADCPVILVMVQGAYLAWPRWSRGMIRPGRIQVNVSLLFDRDSVQRLSLADMRKKILQVMSYDEYRKQKKNRYRYRTRRPADGMADVCHQCPLCSRELAMQSAARTVTCRFCGNQGLIDTTGLIRPAPANSGRPSNKVWPDVARWHHWQIARLRQEMIHGACKRTCTAILSWPDEPDNHQVIKGTLIMMEQSLSFSPDSYPQHDQNADLTIPLKYCSGIGAQFGSYFDIAYDDRVFRFTLEPGQAVIVLADMIRAHDG